MSQQNMPKAVVNMFSLMNGWLYTDPVQGAKKQPTLRIGVFGNNPRLTVRTNVEGDQNYGKIDFNCDLATFAAAIAYIRRLAKGDAVEPHMEFVYQNDFVAGKKLDSIIPLTNLVVGKDGEGRIYIALISSQTQRPRIKFYFGPSKFHDILLKDKSKAGPGLLSQCYAEGWAKPAYDLVIHYLTADFDPNAKGVANPNNMNNGQGAGGGGGFGGQRQGGGGGGYGGGQQQRQSAPAANFDADVPDFF